MPEGYAPGLVLDLRTQPEGGALRTPGELRGALAQHRRSECLVLVHGYNNHAGEAAAAYLGFRAQQHALGSTQSNQALEQQLGDVFWPGDVRWVKWVDWLDFLVYPAAVHTAQAAGPVLADVLRHLYASGVLRVSLLGHSLGCRVVLETLLDLYQRGGGPALGRIALMAAAVPIEHLGPHGRFEGLLRQLQTDRIPIKILHSTDDRVLRMAFPPGQALAGPTEASVRALGLKGPVAHTPGHGANLTDDIVSGAAHSDYWGHTHSDAAHRAAQAVEHFFKFNPVARTLESRDHGRPRTVGQSRSIGASR